MAATNEEIASKIGLTHSGVSRIRSGDRMPLTTTMLAVERAYGWTVEAQARAVADGKYAEQFELHVANHAAVA